MTERELIMNELQAMVDYANLTEDGRAMLLNAIRIIKEGDDLERAERIADAAERMLRSLREEYNRALAALHGEPQAEAEAGEAQEEPPEEPTWARDDWEDPIWDEANEGADREMEEEQPAGEPEPMQEDPGDAPDPRTGFYPRVLEPEDIRNLQTPALIWVEHRKHPHPMPMEILAIQTMKDENGENLEVAVFADGGDALKMYGGTYRYWDLKPSREEMTATPWPDELEGTDDGGE